MDGWIFLTMLNKCINIKIKYSNFIENCDKWTFKLSNLKMLVSSIEDYFNHQINKNIKTNDIDLI